MAWTTKGKNCFNPTTINATILCTNFLRTNFLLHTLLIENFQLFLTLLTHQHHLAEFYLTMPKIELEIFQKTTCTLGVTYNMWNAYQVIDAEYGGLLCGLYKFLLLTSFRNCSLWWRYFVYTMGRFLNNLLFSVFHYDLEQTAEVTEVICH